MFCTLKQSGLSNESYTFETTTPPFSRKREGRLAKIACKSCRTSKLKCSGEPDGCHRCLARKIECCYPSTPRGNGHKKNTSSPKIEAATATPTAATRVPTPPETPQSSSSGPSMDSLSSSSSSSSTDMRPEEDEFISAISHPEIPYSRSLEGFDMSLGDFHYVPDFTTPESMGIMDGEYIDPSNFGQSWQQMTFDMSSDKSSWTATGGGTDFHTMTSSSSSPETLSSSSSSSSSNPYESSCSCYSQAIGTYEAIEVAAWGQREEWSNADDILRYQKRALSECEELLECRSCNRQSSYTMLVLSMCSRILATLEELSQGGDCHKGGAAEKKRRKREERERNSSSSSSRGYGISIRNRQLDDDDEHLVVQSLLTARVARLGRLLSTLDGIVAEHSWPAHKGLIRDLQARLGGSSFVVDNSRRG
ncbi:hypothetical protein F5Y17DRAFT_459859 [Xylariaceae sp. FL0594]|nr:hypothetical protein F5Y17DRAFT_459859 [Xylariaceae sp. FL0594]